MLVNNRALRQCAWAGIAPQSHQGYPCRTTKAVPARSSAMQRIPSNGVNTSKQQQQKLRPYGSPRAADPHPGTRPKPCTGCPTSSDTIQLLDDASPSTSFSIQKPKKQEQEMAMWPRPAGLQLHSPISCFFRASSRNRGRSIKNARIRCNPSEAGHLQMLRQPHGTSQISPSACCSLSNICCGRQTSARSVQCGWF